MSQISPSIAPSISPSISLRIPALPSTSSKSSIQIAGNEAGRPQPAAAGQLDGFVDQVTDVFGKITADLNTQIDTQNDLQRQRQIAMFDLLAIRDALADYRFHHPDQKGDIDLAEIEITVSEDSPSAIGGGNIVTLKAAMDYYHNEHGELQLPVTPKAAGDLEYYMDRIDRAVKMVLEPTSQDAHTEMVRLTQQARAMEQLQATLYQIYYDALKKYVNAS